MNRTLSHLAAQASLLLLAVPLTGRAAAPERMRSPRKPPAHAVILFNGGDTSRWVKAGTEKPIGWKVEKGALEVVPGAGDILTTDRWSDFRMHLEFNVPLMPNAHGQERGNSGVKLHGLYEIQILDSYGLKPGKGECGALYNQVAPRVNACKPPNRWQTYDITFRAPRFDKDHQVARQGSVTVYQNGILVQDATPITRPTRANPLYDAAMPGPVLLQDHGCRVRFRNIWLLPLAADASPAAG